MITVLTWRMIWEATKFTAAWIGMAVVLAAMGYAMLAWPGGGR